jgi:hypothetical protein
MSSTIRFKINIKDLVDVYKRENSLSRGNYESRFLCNILKDNFNVPSDMNIEITLQVYFSKYFNLVNDYDQYSVVPLWFSKRNESGYTAVTLKDGGKLSMEGIDDGMKFRIKLMEYIIEHDPDSELVFISHLFM